MQTIIKLDKRDIMSAIEQVYNVDTSKARIKYIPGNQMEPEDNLIIEITSEET